MYFARLVPFIFIVIPALSSAAADKIVFRSGSASPTLDLIGNLEIPVDARACVSNYVATDWNRDGYCCYDSDHKQRFANALAQQGKTLVGFSPVYDKTKFVVSPENKKVLFDQFAAYWVKASVGEQRICLEFVSPNYGYGTTRWSKKPSEEVLAGSKVSVDFNYALASAPDTEL